MSRFRAALPLAAIFLIALAVRLVAIRATFDGETFFAKYWALGEELRRSHFIADRPFSYAPIYCYFIALAQLVLGQSVVRTLVLQALAGAASCTLIFLVARPLIGPRWAWAPALVACFYRSFVLYDVTLLSDALGLALELGLLVALARLDPGWRPWRYVLAGLLAGLSALHRPNNLLLLPLVLAVLLVIARGAPRRRVLRGAALLVGTALLATLPVVLQNARLTGTPGIMASNPGYILYSSNNAASFGFRYSPPELFYRGSEYYERREDRQPEARFLGDAEIATMISGAIAGHPMSLSESSRYYLDFTLAHVSRHPGYYAALALRKLLLAFNGYESHDVAPVFAIYDRVARLTPLSFAIVAPLGLLGLALSLARWRDAVWLWAVLANNLALLLVFYVVVRFRLPLEAVLVVFSGLALEALWRWTRRRDVRRLLVSGAALAGLYFACNFLPGELAERARYRDLEVRLEDAARVLQKGDLERGAEALERLIRDDREDLPRSVTAHRMLARVYAATGRTGAGSAMKSPDYFEPGAVTRRLTEKWQRRTITFPELQYLAFLYRSSGERAQEQAVLREALARRPPEPLSRYELARSQLESGEPGAAQANLLTAVGDGLLFTTRGLHGAMRLAQIFEAEGRPDEARAWVTQAARLSALAPWYPNEPETHELLERLPASPGYETPPRLEDLLPFGRR